MRLKPALTLEDAKLMVQACERASKAIGRQGTIVIVDSGGHVIYVERPDHQSPNSVDVASMKARTAAFRERPSSNLEERVKERPGWLMFPNGLPMAGGVPLFHGKECIGGIAVSGIAEDDEKVAEAGAAAFAAASKKA
jgi:glc operon protein GlcG